MSARSATHRSSDRTPTSPPAEGPIRGGRGRRRAVIGLLVALVALVAVIVVTTPWSPLPGPVPGGRVAVDAARDFTPAQLAREDAFHAAYHPPAYLSLGLGLLVAGVLGLTPLGARLVDGVGRPFGRWRTAWPLRAGLGAIAVSLVGRLVTLPVDAWGEEVLRRYRLSTESWPAWLTDQGRGFAVTAVLVAVVAVVLVGLARAFPRGWWLPAALAAGALVLVASFLYPLVVEPLFNRFTPLPAGQLRTSLLTLARRDGVPVDGVLVADASRRTSSINAYVSGFGSTRRIVIYDTLLQAPPAEVRLIVAHELGHAKRNDVLHGTIEGALAAAVAACLLFLLLGWSPLLRRAGLSGAADPRAVALLLFLAAAMTFLASPGQNLVSRRIEARADVHALDLTRDPATFVRSERRLAVSNLSDLDPGPIVYGLFADHPTSPQRIALARDWARQHHVAVPPGLR